MDSTNPQGAPAPDGNQVWRGGGWLEKPNDAPPYNGLQITATPKYDTKTSELMSISLAIQDFTKAKAGADHSVEFNPVRDGTKIELPKPAGDLTVSGSFHLFSSSSAPGMVVLFANLRWGLLHQQHHSDGGILEVAMVKTGASEDESPEGAEEEKWGPAGFLLFLQHRRRAPTMGHETIRLRMINRSGEAPPPEVIVWQSNDAPGAGSTPVVWRVIRRCWRDWTHPFALSSELSVRLRDGSGAGHTVPVWDGTRLQVSRPGSGGLGVAEALAQNPSLFEVCNLGCRGPLDIEVQRGGRVLAVQRHLGVGAAARFRFRPTLWLSAVSGLEEGTPLDETVWLGVPVALDPFGLLSADIVMTGGGPGSGSTPLTFHLTRRRTWPR